MTRKEEDECVAGNLGGGEEGPGVMSGGSGGCANHGA